MDLILKSIESRIDEYNKPCKLPCESDIIILQEELTHWQLDKQNDCLRARGDARWLKSIELEFRINNLLKSF